MMGKRDGKHDADRVLDVDASMQGSLVFKDPVNLRINGRFEGTLNAKGSLKVGEHAVVSADITGEYIVISGKVNGAVCAIKELRLLPGAVVNGDIRTPVLGIAEGAVFDGRCCMTPKVVAEDNRKPIAMTPEDVAKYLEVDAAMVLDWVNSGKLPGMRDGDMWRFDRAKIDAWVASGKIR